MRELFQWPPFRAFPFALVCVVALSTHAQNPNVAVIINQNSSNSVQLGNYYVEQRRVPPENLLRISWAGSDAIWTRSEFESALVTPLQAMLAQRQLTNQIEFVVLSMDIPYKVVATNGVNSTTAALHYGFKTDSPAPGPGLPASCSLPTGSASAYAGSEGIFRQTGPGTNMGAFLVSMITASNLTLAKRLVDQGVAGDSTLPIESVVLAKSTDWARNIRFQRFDNTIFDTRLQGTSVFRTNLNSPLGRSNILGFQIGVHQFGISSNVFVPGAIADSLTSFGGNIFEPNDHTTLLAFIHAGAAGSYGTIVEPCAYLEKFPDPQVYFYQARGFTLAEAYYQSLANPYQGLIVGDPLAATFAISGNGFWLNNASNIVLSGVTNLSLEFTAADARHPLQQVDLFVDGRLHHTITNLVPSQGDDLYVTLPGATNLNFSVPSGATIRSIAEGLTTILNSASNATQVIAYPRGDRIELQSLSLTRSGPDTFLISSNAAGSATIPTTFVRAASTGFFDSTASGIRPIQIAGTVVPGDYLALTVVKTNGSNSFLGVTNNLVGITLMQFVQQLVNAINSASALQGLDGIAAEDLVQIGTSTVRFNLRSRAPGLNAAQAQAIVDGSFSIDPSGFEGLDENISDLRPRNHLLITAGVTNLPLTFPLDTTELSDGYHELTAVAYEGSHVRTRTSVSQRVRIQNSSLSAELLLLFGGTNIAREASVDLQVEANTNTISRIELFSTGGLISVTTNESSSIFSTAAAQLDVGLHPFYALVTRTDGQRYRTDTSWVRVIEAEPPITLTLTNPPPTLLWPATAGRQYEVLMTTNLSLPFQAYDSLTSTGSFVYWTEPNPTVSQRFYRVRPSP